MRLWNGLLIASAALGAALFLTHQSGSQREVVLAQQQASISPTPVTVTGTPGEVALVKSILAGMNTVPLSINSVAVASQSAIPAPSPQPAEGDVFLNIGYGGASTPQVDVETSFDAELLIDAYSQQCAAAGVPCADGVSILNSSGRTGGDGSYLVTPSDRPASVPGPSLVSAVQAAAAKTDWQDVQVHSYTSDTTAVLVTASVASPSDVSAGLQSVWSSIDNQHPMIVEVRDAQTGEPLLDMERTEDSGATWIAPAVREAMGMAVANQP